jgi:gas vesicle protein
MRPSRLSVFVVGLVAGLAVGVLAGLLFAPSSGTRTRRIVKDRLIYLAGTARVVAERAEHAAELLGERVEHYLGRDEELAWRKVREIREGVQRYTETQLSS